MHFRWPLSAPVSATGRSCGLLALPLVVYCAAVVLLIRRRVRRFLKKSWWLDDLIAVLVRLHSLRAIAAPLGFGVLMLTLSPRTTCESSARWPAARARGARGRAAADGPHLPREPRARRLAAPRGDRRADRPGQPARLLRPRRRTRSTLPTALMLLDLDRFKELSATLGGPPQRRARGARGARRAARARERERRHRRQPGPRPRAQRPPAARGVAMDRAKDRGSGVEVDRPTTRTAGSDSAS